MSRLLSTPCTRSFITSQDVVSLIHLEQLAPLHSSMEHQPKCIYQVAILWFTTHSYSPRDLTSPWSLLLATSSSASPDTHLWKTVVRSFIGTVPQVPECQLYKIREKIFFPYLLGYRLPCCLDSIRLWSCLLVTRFRWYVSILILLLSSSLYESWIRELREKSEQVAT